jgi:hypothetical protein
MVYSITTVILILTVAAFFAWGRRGLSPFGRKQWVLRVVVALPLLISCIVHFAGQRCWLPLCSLSSPSGRSWFC